MDATLISSVYDQAAPLERVLNEQARLYMPELMENGRVQPAVLPVPLLIDDIHFAIARAYDHGIISRVHNAIEHGEKERENSSVVRGTQIARHIHRENWMSWARTTLLFACDRCGFGSGRGR